MLVRQNTTQKVTGKKHAPGGKNKEKILLSYQSWTSPGYPLVCGIGCHWQPRHRCLQSPLQLSVLPTASQAFQGHYNLLLKLYRTMGGYFCKHAILDTIMAMNLDFLCIITLVSCDPSRWHSIVHLLSPAHLLPLQEPVHLLC